MVLVWPPVSLRVLGSESAMHSPDRQPWLGPLKRLWSLARFASTTHLAKLIVAFEHASQGQQQQPVSRPGRLQYYCALPACYCYHHLTLDPACYLSSSSP